MATRSGIEASAIRPFAFAGLDGVQLDMHAQAANTHIFGGPEGNFGLEPKRKAQGKVWVGIKLVKP